MNAGLSRVPHGIHKDGRQELGHDNPHLGPDQFVGEYLGEELGGLFAHVGVGGVTVEVEQVDERSFVERLLEQFGVGCEGMERLQGQLATCMYGRSWYSYASIIDPLRTV